MSVSLKNPLHLEPTEHDEIEQLACRVGSRVARDGVVIEHGIDDRSDRGRRIRNDVTER